MSSPDEAPEAPRSLRVTALSASAATGAAQVLRVGLQFLSTVILARLLTPEDFGMVAMVMPAFAFVSLFQDFGFQQAVIQKAQVEDSQLTRVFWLGVMICTGIALLLCAVSPLVALFYREPRAGPLTAAWALPLFIGGFGAVPSAILARRMKYANLALIDVAGAVAGFGVAVAVAYVYRSYWSLWLASVATGVVTVALAWAFSRWRPGHPFTRAPAGDLVSFGMNLTGYSVVNFFARNLDNVVIAKFHGSAALGLYDRAYKLLLFPLQNISGPAGRVMIPILSRLQDDPPRLRRAYLKAAGQIALVSVPAVAAATATSAETVEFLLGARWAGVAPIFAWLGLSGILQPLSNTTGWLFIAQARTKALFWWGIVSATVTVASFFVGLPWGAVGVAAAYALADWLVRTPLLVLVLHRLGLIRASELLGVQAPLIGAAAITFLAIGWLRAQTSLSGLALMTVAAILAYGASAIFLCGSPQGREVVLDTWKLVAASGRALGARGRRAA